MLHEQLQVIKVKCERYDYTPNHRLSGWYA